MHANKNPLRGHFTRTEDRRDWGDAPVSEHASLLLKDEVYQIVGAALEVLNVLGHGLNEKPYENALVVEFGLRNIPAIQQARFEVIYKKCKVADYIPDLIAFEAIVVDVKTIDAITDHERGQILNYLRITGLKVGVLLNFKKAKLQWERLVLEHNRRP